MHLQHQSQWILDTPEEVDNINGSVVTDELDIAIVIVNYNHDEFVYRCLDSITASDNHPAEVIVIDNASEITPSNDNAGHGINTHIIANRKNVGFARAVNQAIRKTNTKYVLILNPDTVVKPDAIRNMVQFMEDHPDAGIAGGKLLHPDGTLQWSCRTFYTPITILFRRSPLGKLWPDNPISIKHLMADWDHKSAKSVDWVLGACMIVRRDAIQDVGMMDEGFFLYFEDVDWCYRMQQHNWKVYYCPDAEIIHHHLRSSSRLNRTALYHICSMLYYYRKHFLSNLLPDCRSADRRAKTLQRVQRVLRIRRIPLWRKLAVALSCRMSSMLSVMAKFGHKLSRGRAPELHADYTASDKSMSAVVDLAGRIDRDC